MMATIGFFPLHETSHVNATFGLAKKLKARGHRVCYLAIPDFEEYVCSQGLEFRPFCPDLFPKGSQQRIAADPAAAGRLWQKAFEMLCRGELDDVIRNCGFDLLIVDTWAQQLALIAYKVGVPAVLLSPTLPVTRDAALPPATEAIVPDTLLARMKIRLWWLKYDLHRLKLYLKKETVDYVRPMRAIAQSANYPLEHFDATGPSPVLKLFPELILSPQAFDLPRSKKDGRIRYIGALVDLQRKENVTFPWDRLDADKKLVYCALGTLSYRFGGAQAFLRMIIDAVAAQGDRQLVMAIGDHLSVDDFHPIPPNVILVNRAPQLQILQRASVNITHGGLNTIKESILLGVPMIIFPWSRPVNAVRVVYHGLGLMSGIDQVSVARIQTLLDTIDRDPGFRIRVEAMKKKFIELEDSATGVEAVESFLPRPVAAAGA
jgi:MGT family glycosyltransferase